MEIKTQNTISSIATTLIEMQEQGMVPTEYKLPYIIFEDAENFDRVELENPALQAMVEDEMNKIIEDKTIRVNTNLDGLIQLINNPKIASFKDVPKGNDVYIYFKNDKFDFAFLKNELDISELSLENLKKLYSFLKTKKVTQNKEYKYTLFSVGNRLKKLQSSIL